MAAYLRCPQESGNPVSRSDFKQILPDFPRSIVVRHEGQMEK
jgi:hypothetical protein